MGSRVVPTTATPDPWWFNINEGTVRSTVRSQAIVMSAGRQIRQASKQTIKNEQCRSSPPKSMPQANSHRPWAFASQGGYMWQIANFGRRYATVGGADAGAVPPAVLVVLAAGGTDTGAKTSASTVGGTVGGISTDAMTPEVLVGATLCRADATAASAVVLVGDVVGGADAAAVPPAFLVALVAGGVDTGTKSSASAVGRTLSGVGTDNVSPDVLVGGALGRPTQPPRRRWCWSGTRSAATMRTPRRWSFWLAARKAASVGGTCRGRA